MDAQAAARDAGLRYVDDRMPGIRRRRRVARSRTFTRTGSRSATSANCSASARWRSRRPIPTSGSRRSPTATCRRRAATRAGASSTATTSAGARCATRRSISGMVAFGAALPRIRAAVAKRSRRHRAHARARCSPRWSRCSTSTGIRVGNEEYAQANDSFGLTTLRTRHVRLKGSEVRLHFRGKTGRRHLITLDDARLARIIKRCRDLPGEELFTYFDETASRHERELRRRQRLHPRDRRRRVFRERLPHVDRHGGVHCRAGGARGAPGRGEEQRDGGAGARRRAAGQHPGRVPQGVRAPGVIETYTRLRRLPKRSVRRKIAPARCHTPNASRCASSNDGEKRQATISKH